MNFIHFLSCGSHDEMRACGRRRDKAICIGNIRHLGIHPSYWLDRHKPFLIAFASLLLLADENAFFYLYSSYKRHKITITDCRKLNESVNKKSIQVVLNKM